MIWLIGFFFIDKCIIEFYWNFTPERFHSNCFQIEFFIAEIEIWLFFSTYNNRIFLIFFFTIKTISMFLILHFQNRIGVCKENGGIHNVRVCRWCRHWPYIHSIYIWWAIQIELSWLPWGHMFEKKILWTGGIRIRTHDVSCFICNNHLCSPH